jgi:TPR repeat protein
VQAAELGNVNAMEKVSFAYFFGNQLRQNLTTAKSMFEKLSLLGNPRGQLVKYLCCCDSILKILFYE